MTDLGECAWTMPELVVDAWLGPARWFAYSERTSSGWALVPLKPSTLPFEAETWGDGFAFERDAAGAIIRYWISRESAEREGLLECGNSGLGAVEE